MPSPADFQLLAAYNADMNGKLYAAAAQLSPAEIVAPRGAFFGSLLATLNHLVVGDTLWLQRFATMPVLQAVLAPIAGSERPTSLTQSMAPDLAALRRHRERLDTLITAMAAALDAQALEQALEYRSSRGDIYRKRFGDVLLHFFNHQTHHRGQASTLLTQAGVDLGVTDLIVMVADL